MPTGAYNDFWLEKGELSLRTREGPRDIASVRANLPEYSSALQRRTSSLRVGVPRTFFYEDVDPQMLDAVERDDADPCEGVL